MIAAREDLYSALFALLSKTPGFASYWRRYPPIETLSTAQKPALLMRQRNETVTAGYAIPGKYHLLIELCIVVQTPTIIRDMIPATQINTLLDAVETQLAPDAATGKLTLGLANVSRVWIEGAIEIYEAVSQDTSYCYVPVNVIAT